MGTVWAMSGNQQAAGGGTGGVMGFLPMILVMFVIMYFLILRPQQKKQKEVKAMLENIKKGDRVSTIGGILGTVVGAKDDVVTLKIAENTKVDFKKSAISAVLSHEGGESA